MSSFITSLPTNTQTPAPNSFTTIPSKQVYNTYRSPSQPINIIEEEYLNYAVTQNTKYSDLEKIEKQYKILSVQRFNIYNKNKSRIAKLQKINNILSSQIQSSLITYFQLSIDDFLINYNNKIQQMKRLVKIKEHEQETYKTLYNRLYYNNILLNKRIHSELEYADIYKTQHTKYQILKNHALLSFSRQYKKFEKMKNYDEVSSIQMKQELLQKAKLANTLDYQIDLIKNDVKYTEKKLKQYSASGQIIQGKIILQSQKYDIYYNDYLWVRKLFLKEFSEFNKILSILRVRDINVLINKFNSLRNEYQVLLSQFKICNNDVTNLNNTLTELEISLSNLKQRIINKQKKLLSTTNTLTSNENTCVTKIQNQIKEIRLDLYQIGVQCDKKTFILQSIMLFLLNNLRKLLQQGECIQISKNSGDYLIKLTNIITNTNKELTITYEHIGPKMIVELCFIMRKCFDCYFHLFFNSLNNIISDHIRYQFEFYLNKDCNVYDIYNGEYIKIYQQYVSFSIKQIEDKVRIMKKKEKQLLSSLRTIEDKSQVQNKKMEINKSVLYRNFIEYLKSKSSNKKSNINKNSDKKKNVFVTTNDPNNINKFNKNKLNKKNFVSNHPRQIMKMMDKYKNYLVVDDINYNSLQNTFTSEVSINNNETKIRKRNCNLNNYNNYSNNSSNLFHENTRTNNLNNSNSSSFLKFHIKHKNILSKANTSRLSTSLNNKSNSRNQLFHSFCEVGKINDNFGGNEEYILDEDEEENDLLNNICEDNILTKNNQNKSIFNHKKGKYEFYKNNPEMAIIHKRQNDLRTLDMKYGNGMTTYNKIDNVDFNEAFYKFEKKYLKKSNIKSLYSIANLRKGNNVSKSCFPTLNNSGDGINKYNRCTITTLNKKHENSKVKTVSSISIKKKRINNINMSNTSNSNSHNNTAIFNTNYNKHKMIKSVSSFSFFN